MKPVFSYSIKAGLLAFGLAAGLSAPVFAGPMLPAAPSAPASASTSDIVPVRAEWAGGNDRSDYWRRNGHYRQWQGNRWRQNNWRGYRNDWRGHRHFRRHYGGSGIYFGLGGFGIGPAYDYYGPNYYAPDYYAPRRTYRVYRGSNAHVRWCYNRYRSYRASDNTFQPYHGPRQQCYSPYR